MTIEEIHFVLDSFMHFMPEDEVEDFVRNSVGKWVTLTLNDANKIDSDCVDGWIDGDVRCHVSARKAAMVRRAITESGRKCVMVRIKGHNLDRGYKTAYCELMPPNVISDDFVTEREKEYEEWMRSYDGGSGPLSHDQQKLGVNIDFLSQMLQNDVATESDLLPVIRNYIASLHMAFSCDEKEDCIKVNELIQNSVYQSVRDCNVDIVKAMDFLNHPEIRLESVRKWIEWLKETDVCQREALQIRDRKGLAKRYGMLMAFPRNLFSRYESDFVTFCGNLFYNKIPSAPMQLFMTGVAGWELAKARIEAEEASAGMDKEGEDEKVEYGFVVDQRYAEAVVELVLSYMDGKDRSQAKDIMKPIRAAQDAGVIRRITFEEMQLAFPDYCPTSKSSVSKYTKEDDTPYSDEAFKAMVKDFKSLLNGQTNNENNEGK